MCTIDPSQKFLVIYRRIVENHQVTQFLKTFPAMTSEYFFNALTGVWIDDVLHNCS